MKPLTPMMKLDGDVVRSWRRHLGTVDSDDEVGWRCCEGHRGDILEPLILMMELDGDVVMVMEETS